MREKKRLKWVKRGISITLIVAVISGGIFYFVNRGTASADIGSTRTYQTQEVKKDEISIGVSGSGTLSPVKSESITSSYSGTVTSVNKKVGDSVMAGEVIATISSEKLENAISEMEQKINDLEVKIAGTDETTSTKYITSSVKGRAKLIKASAGDTAEDIISKYGYLCVISTDGKMKVIFETSKKVKKYATVTVKIGTTSDSGTITNVSGKKVTVEIDTNTYPVGKTAKVYNSSGTLLGSGSLNLCQTVPVKDVTGKISSVVVSNNEYVYSGTKLFYMKSYTANSEYQSLIDQKTEYEEQLESLYQQKNVSVDFKGTITALPIAKGDTVNRDSALCTVKGKKGFKLTVSVDELDIGNVKLNDSATITLDAIKGNFTGKVTYISNVGNTDSSVTNYDVVITTDDIEGALSGMNASATVTTQSSGDSLVVPVNAVIKKQNESYVYLAPEGSSVGDEVDQSSVNTNDLTKVTVTPGMSDGNFIVVEGDGLAEGILIYVPVVTTTSDRSGNSSRNNGMGVMIDMGGGQMPSGGGNWGGNSNSRSGNMPAPPSNN